MPRGTVAQKETLEGRLQRSMVKNTATMTTATACAQAVQDLLFATNSKLKNDLGAMYNKLDFVNVYQHRHYGKS